jgi:hypothetical protein
MSNKILNLLLSIEQPCEFAFGVPWWDYWIPFILIESNINLISSKEDIILHETHHTNYSHRAYKDIGCKFLSYYNNIYPSKFNYYPVVDDNYDLDTIFNFSQSLNDNFIIKKIIYR